MSILVETVALERDLLVINGLKMTELNYRIFPLWTGEISLGYLDPY
jgi:hypothetical protein